MTIGGWVMLVTSWMVLLVLSSFCLAKVLRQR